ncbi:MAG: hypothetical protein KDA89_21635, partial [Planctomycetaceae bacterium]|nr:hypothetical protein [Planctomycetaceae bacterium]
DAAQQWQDLLQLHSQLREFQDAADDVLQSWQHFSPDDLLQILNDMSAATDQLPDYLHCLEAAAALPPSVREAAGLLALDTEQLEAASTERTFQQVLREHPELARFSGESQTKALTSLRKAGEAWLDANARAVREVVRQRFCENVRVSSASATQLDDDQKELKKVYSRGRRELEHEFGKSMRYKSIRELADGDTGMVIRDLKPVWLMSPLSVSDTLPLSAEHFDAVIFDEASQITLEDAVPALFRADQAIVVGDEMQLPPTSFFASRQDDDAELEFEEQGEVVRYDLNSSSLLNHSSRNLRSTLLGWHYRSRSESLISFSNHAFYAGRLLTVPEHAFSGDECSEISVLESADAEHTVTALLQRPVSFHFMQNGVYEKRRNTAEAEYIARLVRQLLRSEQRHSIGVVAFSEAQQTEIDRALRRLADEDAEFAEALDAELERDDDGQFEGLLVRNLENIQGDERDVILMSVCYGPDPQGRIRMNFGPINMSGGEKRLNVAFSRARKHMVLVSSMRSAAITNDYNDGANCLKQYLRYAEAASAGQQESASAVLQGLSGRTMSIEESRSPSRDVLTRDVAQAVTDMGFDVDYDVGQSHFRVDLAVRQPNGNRYILGIFTDSPRWYAQRDLLERELLKPQLLTAFGWQILTITAKDWICDHEACCKRLRSTLSQNTVGENKSAAKR